MRAALTGCLALGLTAAAPAGAQSPAPPLLAGATQLVVVTTPDWNATSGEMRRYERADPGAAWRAVGGAIPIVVGRAGLAWGVGFDGFAEGAEPHKPEGDGKSPAGVFPATTECVHDTASAHYTNVLDRGAVPRVDWTSPERMRSIGVYRLGAVIAYNEAPPVKGRG